MTMSSYLMNSNYIDPKFPPCEEYSQNDYISAECYRRARDADYQQELLYPQSVTYQEGKYECESIPEHEGHLHGAKTYTPPTAVPAQTTAPELPSNSKEPVVYPWMRKIHSSAGRQTRKARTIYS